MDWETYSGNRKDLPSNPPVLLLDGSCWGCWGHSVMHTWVAAGLASSWACLLAGCWKRRNPARSNSQKLVCWDKEMLERSLPLPVKRGMQKKTSSKVTANTTTYTMSWRHTVSGLFFLLLNKLRNPVFSFCFFSFFGSSTYYTKTKSDDT